MDAVSASSSASSFCPLSRAHYRFGSPLAQRLVSGKKTSPVKDSQLIERLDHHRETNGSVQVAFRNDEAETFLPLG
ncbi:hypothetical protein ACP0HM_09795 [Escherichia coli]